MTTPYFPQTDEEWTAWSAEQLATVSTEMQAKAVAVLRANLSDSTKADLKERIAEDPVHWLMGRKNATCWYCRGTGETRALKRDVAERLERLRPDRYVITAADMARTEEAAKDPANLEPPETCRICRGTTKAAEMPLHHGWGTGIRNLLREHGCGEKDLGVENLDDVYAQLVELAVA